MPEQGLLDTLVKLANLGASGVAIFAIFWVGWLLKSDTGNNAAKQGSIRCYIGFCCAIIVVLAIPTLLKSRNDSLKQKLEECEQKSRIYTVEGVVEKVTDTGELAKPHGIVVSIIGYPNVIMESSGKISPFDVQRQAGSGKLPVLNFTAQGYNSTTVALEGRTKPDNNEINIGTVTLNELPPE